MKEDIGMIITIDGPAGAGKSTVSKVLAERLNYGYLDTGALYRAVAYKIIQNNVSVSDEAAMSDLLKHMKINVYMTGNAMKVFMDSEDVTDLIRTEEIGLMASKISAGIPVRHALLAIQREAGKRGSIIAEGRDMGTVVFPHADVKFFLDANARVRTNRRYNELIAKGIDADLRAIENDLNMRDKQDRERTVAPLKIPEGAIIIDSSNLKVLDVVENMMNFVNKKNESLKTQ
ncbi:MAG: (d)CMP kinase [Deltaproteobacteria bacterium]|nr:(d)CMP kinase [Deltaproteobacteria bacterium]